MNNKFSLINNNNNKCVRVNISFIYLFSIFVVWMYYRLAFISVSHLNWIMREYVIIRFCFLLNFSIIFRCRLPLMLTAARLFAVVVIVDINFIVFDFIFHSTHITDWPIRVEFKYITIDDRPFYFVNEIERKWMDCSMHSICVCFFVNHQ